MIQPQEIQALIETGLAGCTAIVTGHDGRHFDAIVISTDFFGKSRVQKQQMVYTTLGNRIADNTIHAISIKTFTPDEWQKQQEI